MFSVDSWDFTLTEILRENLWMYKISPKIFKILEKEVKQFYFGNQDICRMTIPELVDVSILMSQIYNERQSSEWFFGFLDFPFQGHLFLYLNTLFFPLAAESFSYH